MFYNLGDRSDTPLPVQSQKKARNFRLKKKSHCTHHENRPMQYKEIFFSAVKLEKLIGKILDIYNIFAPNIDCGYTLELPSRGGSNEYPQTIFWIKNKKSMYTTVNPSFTV